MLNLVLTFVLCVSAAALIAVDLRADSVLPGTSAQVELPVTIELHDNATVSDDFVKLGSVANCNGYRGFCDEFNTIDLVKAPPPGERDLLRQDKIRQSLAIEWPNAKLTIKGSQTVMIFAESEPISTETLDTAIKSWVKSLTKPDDGYRFAVQWVTPIGIPRSRPGGCSLRVLPVSGDFDLRESFKDPLTVDLECESPNPRISLIKIAVKVKLQIESRLLATVRRLDAGSTVQDQDTNFVWKSPVGNSFVTMLSSLDSVRGKPLSRSVEAGQILQDNLFGAPLAVKRGQTMRLEITNGAIVLTSDVEALRDGHIGETIDFVYGKTKQKVKAVIISSNLAQMER